MNGSMRQRGVGVGAQGLAGADPVTGEQRYATTIEIFDALRNNNDEIVRFDADVDEALLVLP